MNINSFQKINLIILVVFALSSCKPKSKFDRLVENNATPAYKTFLSKSEINVPVYPLTKGPGYHWFAYYDKFQTDPTDRYVLSMESDFENRSPEPGDEIMIGMIDLHQGGKWIALGSTRAWNWQQGCMLQWRPGKKDEILWNDREDGRFVCHILNVKTMKKRTIPSPIYTVSPDGKFGMSLDFERIQDLRKGYGYTGVPDENKEVLSPADAGIYKVSLDDGSKKLVVSIKEIANISFPSEDLSANKHYFNHLDINTEGDRFLFLHRWITVGDGARVSPLGTRFYTASVDGGNLHIVNDSKMTSHFWWKNNKQILAWANRPETGNHFYLFNDALKPNPEVVGKEFMITDGHCSYLQNKDWILNDTYPDENHRIELYLFNTKTNKKVVLGKFYLPPEYSGEWRVDTHPRQSRDGKKIIIDCVMEQSGRQMLMLDISGLEL